ncbi:hypothetical protein [Legionella massiliensis]|uniref:hypothetical protein n=1 Tax=Legionella massiliensis TaxID=1034943 RepID=UPI0005C354B6|nr:hypothetical protein [Legionella massiliensis]
MRHPSHFRGFASISPYDVGAAVNELERAINQLNFAGWLTIQIMVRIITLTTKNIGLCWKQPRI